MGLTVGTWRFPDRAPPDVSEVQRALRDATGLHIDRGDDERSLSIPLIRQLLLGWEYDGNALTLHGFIPAHPYLWESVDRIMSTLGGVRDGDPGSWQPRPTHATLRQGWDALAPRDRWLLRLWSVAGVRPFDRFLSGPRSAQ